MTHTKLAGAWGTISPHSVVGVLTLIRCLNQLSKGLSVHGESQTSLAGMGSPHPHHRGLRPSLHTADLENPPRRPSWATPRVCGPQNPRCSVFPSIPELRCG